MGYTIGLKYGIYRVPHNFICNHCDIKAIEKFKIFTKPHLAMLFSKSKDKQDNLYKQSLLKRIKPKLFGNERVSESRSKHQSMPDEKEIKEWRRDRSLLPEADRNFESCLGPVDDSLLKRAVTAKHKRRTHSLSSIQNSRQLNMMEWQSFDEFRSRLVSLKQQEKHYSKDCKERCNSLETCLKSVKLWKSFGISGIQYKDGQDDDTYIDENGIYTTVLCYTEM